MFPLAQGVTAGAGLLAEGVGSYLSYQAQQGIQNAQQGIIAAQQQIQTQNFHQMELTTNRNQMEVLRNDQRARSLALSNSANQGAQFGSGLQGGYGQIAGQAGNNLLGLNQNEAIGKNIFQSTLAEDASQSQLVKDQGQAATGQAVSQFGSSLMGGSQSAGSLFPNSLFGIS